MKRLLVLGAGLLACSGPTRAAWMADESDRIDRVIGASAGQAPGEKDNAALAGLALGPEAPPLAPEKPARGYAITPPSQRRPTRLRSAPPRYSGSGRIDRLER